MWLNEQAEQTTTVNFIHIRGSSNGSYGYGDQPEIPARNPSYSCYWEFEFDQQKFLALNNLTGTVIVHDEGIGGSYHEAWRTINIQLALPYSFLEENEGVFIGGWGGPDHKRVKTAYSFPYQSLQHTIDTIVHTSDVNYPDSQGIQKLALRAGDPPPPQLPLPQTQQITSPKHGETRDDYWKRLIQAAMPPKKIEGD